MTRAVARTQAWLAGASVEDLVAAVAPFYPHVGREDLLAAFRRYRAAKLWAGDTTVSRTGFDRLARSLHSAGFIARIPTYEDCVVDLT
jgi:NitT/TauT family transport system substrate-binding protein